MIAAAGAALLMVVSVSSANAAGLSIFDATALPDDSFADTASQIAGPAMTTSGLTNAIRGPSGASDTLQSVLSARSTDAIVINADPATVIELGFVDNVVVNEAGADLVLFETFSDSGYAVSVLPENGTWTAYQDYSGQYGNSGMYDTGDRIELLGFSNQEILALEIDLDDFNLAAGSRVVGVRIQPLPVGTSPGTCQCAENKFDPMAAAAINSASADTGVTVTINNSTSTRVIISGETVPAHTATDLDLEPGTYNVQLAPGGFPGAIEISPAGLFSYQAGLEGSIYSGAGTNTLTVVSYPVRLDATDLTGSALVVGLHNPEPDQTFVYDLPPGDYRLQALPGGVLDPIVTVAIGGVVSYDAELDGTMFYGEGTTTIGLVGHPVRVVSTQVEGEVFETRLNTHFPGEDDVAYRLPVGTFRLQSSIGGLLDLADSRTGISVEVDGNIDYDPAVDGLAFTGLGTTTLEVLPHYVTVDATSALSDAQIAFALGVPAGLTDTFGLSVGTYSVSATSVGQLGDFSLNADSTCDQVDFPFNGDTQAILLSCFGGCQDGDQDGFGNPASAACSGGLAEDCNDQDVTIFPGAIELPGNAVDENCDGSLGACDPLARWRNHGQFVRCVANEVYDLIDLGVITEDQGDDLVREAARSRVGKRKHRKRRRR